MIHKFARNIEGLRHPDVLSHLNAYQGGSHGNRTVQQEQIIGNSEAYEAGQASGPGASSQREATKSPAARE